MIRYNTVTHNSEVKHFENKNLHTRLLEVEKKAIGS